MKVYGTMNILVVDDHQDMQDYLQDILSEQGYKVAKAGSADEALASLARDEFHLVDQWGPIHEADMAIRYIQNENASIRDPDKPFALVVAMNPPHDGMSDYEEVPQKYIDLYNGLTYKDLLNRPNVILEGGKYSQFAREQIKNYFAMVSGVDEQFGRILKALAEGGLDENTIVLFFSDHGHCMGNHDLHGKSIFYEESMCIPFLIRWPARIKPRHDDLLISIESLLMWKAKAMLRFY